MNFFKDIKIDLSQSDVLLLLGQKCANTPGRTAKRLSKFTNLARHLVKPKVLYDTSKTEEVGKGAVTLEGGISLKSGKLSKTLGKRYTTTVFLDKKNSTKEAVADRPKEIYLK